MKILHIGLMVNGRNEGLSKAFRDRFGADYTETPVNVESVSKALKKGNYDLVFCQIQSEKISDRPTREVIEAIRPHAGKMINWTGDMRRETPQWMIECQDLFDITAFSNEKDIRNIRNGKFLQIGIDPEVFNHYDDHAAPWHDVVFMGNNYGNQFPLGEYRMSAVHKLSKYDAGIYGNYQGARASLNADSMNPYPMQSREAKIYNNCKIGISISHFREPRYTSDRLLRAMGAGAFVLADYYPQIEKDFSLGVHLDTFRDIREMGEKIDFYLANPKKRQAIADCGYDLIHDKFTYKNMVENILAL